MKKVFLEGDELTELLELYEEAQTTPVIGFSSRQMMEGRDLASQAWDRVRKRFDTLGEKHGFDPQKIKGIDKKTGEILFKDAGP